MSVSKDDILSVTHSVTKEWTRQRKAEERGRRSRESRQYVYSDRVNFTAVAEKILPAAYERVSGGGMYSVAKRQLYYETRQQFQRLTGREISANYFSQNLLVKYLNTHPETASWKITADARGHLVIPNTGKDTTIPIGTIEIERHLVKASKRYDGSDTKTKIDVEWPSLAAGQRFQGVGYIEKEGFEPVLKEANIASQHDMAWLSGKGQSTAAARQFVDETCVIGSGCPLLVLHDFDKAGFQIAARLTTNGDWAHEQDLVKYEFQNQIEVYDLGLRLEDVAEFDLHDKAEKVACKGRRCRCYRCQPLDMTEYGITPAEDEFLRSGRRVELNALTSPQLIELITRKLAKHGLDKRLVPADDVLQEAYLRALVTAEINLAIADARTQALHEYEGTLLPKTIRRKLAAQMKANPDAWDQALYKIALTKVKAGRGR